MDTNNAIVEMNDKRKCQKGVTTVEYAVMLMLVAIAVATATPDISSAVKAVFTSTINVL